ncbi:hypothetical protein ACWEIJ_02280 [Lentzea sp. NPDC004789]
MAELTEDRLPLSKLLLDPNNFRFQDEEGYITADKERFHETSVQDRAFRRIRSEGIVDLKNSITANGFLAVERLVVRPYKNAEDTYVVVEGNRRLAALRWLQEDDQAGVTIPESVRDTFAQVPVVVIKSDDDDSVYLSLMGIRHVGGIRQWGGYQRAKLVTELRDRHSLESAEVGARLGMSTQEVNRRYRAFKALEQMQHDEDFGDLALPSMYPIFHEAVSLPAVRDWLGWVEARNEFTNDEERAKFYGLVTVSEDHEEGSSKAPKITTYAQVRDLRAILPIPEARRLLFDSDRTFGESLAVAKAEELSKSWGAQIAEAVAALKTIGALELKNMKPDDLEDVKSLRDVAIDLLATYEKLNS